MSIRFFLWEYDRRRTGLNNKVLKREFNIAIMLLVVFLGSVPFLFFRDEVRNMAGLGYMGLMAACFLTNATIFLPASGIAFTVSAATVLNPYICCVCGGLGTAFGELISYSCGRVGKKLVEDNKLYRKMQGYISKRGFLTVLIFAFLPFPIFDFVGVAAGAGKMNVAKYTVACIIGKVLKMFVYVILANRLIDYWW